MNQQEVRALLKRARGRFYVYMLLRPDGTPFYVGKGIGTRVLAHEREADGPGCSHKLNTIRMIRRTGGAVGYEIVDFFDDEGACHAREVQEIGRIGRYDLGTGPLTNLTAGGEGTVGLSDETRGRIDALLHGPDAPGERGVANRFFLQLCASVSSVPVRPLALGRPRPLQAVEVTRQPTPRKAAALAASAIANRVLLEPGCVLPRRMRVEGVEATIEFGASTDILRAGMAEIAGFAAAGHEQLRLTHTGFDAVCGFVDPRLLVSAGVLVPGSSLSTIGHSGDLGSLTDLPALSDP